MSRLDHLAHPFCQAFYERRWPGPDTPNLDGLSLTEAYEVQALVADQRIARGERVVGYKVGCTSSAIRKQFGLSEPIYGRLFAPHTTHETSPIDWTQYANCAIEPEMVLTIGKDLAGEALSRDELIDGIQHVSPGIELHHYTFWQQPPTTQELICSGGIHAGLVIGDTRVSGRGLSYRDETFSVSMDGEMVTSAPASEIMGGPLYALRWLVSALTRKGECLSAGSLVIPGSPVELITIDSDTLLNVSIEHIGQVEVLFKEQT